MTTSRQRERARIRVEAPADLDPLVIAQAVVGPHFLLKAEASHAWRSKPFNGRWKALNTLYDRALTSYEKHIKKMVSAIKKYAADEADLLAKAGGRPLFTPEQVQEIARIIRDHHTAFVASFAPDTVAEQEIQGLIDRGILPPETVEFIKDSYLYGQLASTVRAFDDQKEMKKLSYESFKKRLKKRPVPLTEAEKSAISWAEHSAALHVRGLGNKIADDFSTVAIEADADLRRKYEDTIRSETKGALERRETWRKLASNMGHETGDWARDFGRIAATEMQRAHQEGVSQGLKKREGDPETVMVAKIPNSDACKHCVRLHLKNGHGSAPRVFKLSELQENGSNVGRKAADWKAVVGPVHPWCFPAGTSVETDTGPKPIEEIEAGDLVITHRNRLRAVQRLSQRVFVGELVVLSFGDSVLKLTPEHPLLTSRGWVRADAVKVGDDLFQIHEAVASYTESQDGPFEYREERFFARILQLLARAGVPVGIDFDDDSKSGESYIGVEGTYSELWHSLVTRFVESLNRPALVSTRYRILLASFRRLDLLGYRAWLSTYSGVCCLREALSLFRAASSCSDDSLFRDGSDSDARFDKSCGDSPSTSTEAICKFFDAIASFVGSDDFFDRELEHDVTYHAVPVISTSREPFEGPVFNFSVEEDETYIAGGCVVHNCACELVHVPAGWGFADKPPEGEGWKKKGGKWIREKENPSRAYNAPKTITETWIPQMLPDSMRRSEFAFTRDLRKAFVQTYGDSVPDKGVSIRIGDPLMHAEAAKVVEETPKALFDRKVGVTFITTDTPRIGSALDDHDLAYWTGNEIRLSQTLPAEKVGYVLRHELGHALNIHLMYKLGTEQKVRDWHDRLWEISKQEGFVSKYAKKLPIENAAEVTRLYLYERPKLMAKYPRQFTFAHTYYKDIIRSKSS